MSRKMRRTKSKKKLNKPIKKMKGKVLRNSSYLLLLQNKTVTKKLEKIQRALKKLEDKPKSIKHHLSFRNSIVRNLSLFNHVNNKAIWEYKRIG
jgi:acyl-ACP thioesterase